MTDICRPLHAVELPDAGKCACCYGAAVYGPDRCTCWVPVYDLEQQPIQPGLPAPPVPLKMCGDCAYRPRSPERQGEAGYSGDEDFLEDLVETGRPFYCHAGVRRVVRLRHPAGVEIDGHPGAYEPPIHDSVPYKADGTPANLCAGWLLRRAKAAAAPAAEHPPLIPDEETSLPPSPTTCPAPGCTSRKKAAHYLCQGCWFTLKPAARRALSRRDNAAFRRLSELREQLRQDTPLYEVVITP